MTKAKRVRTIATKNLKLGQVIRSPHFVFGRLYEEDKPTLVGYGYKATEMPDSFFDATDESRADADFVVFYIQRESDDRSRVTVTARRLGGKKNANPVLISFNNHDPNAYQAAIPRVVLIGHLQEKLLRLK